MLANIADIKNFDAVIDARSPQEFADDRLPGAINLPALDDEERAAIGALHQQNAFAARRQGAALIAARVAKHLQNTLANKPPSWKPLFYCARGGQRSGGFVEVLRRVGWRAARLHGGYKAWRRHVLAQTPALAAALRWRVLAGQTGVGKTVLLRALAQAGAQTLDLEALANHRGSVFGGMGAQPSQRAFETRLYSAMAALNPAAPVFVESESRKIGANHLPEAVMEALRAAPATRICATQQARTRHILAEYADGKNFLQNLPRLAPHTTAQERERWRALFAAGKLEELTGELLAFYDRSYGRSLQKNYAAAFAAPPQTIDPACPASAQKAARALIAQCAQSQK